MIFPKIKVIIEIIILIHLAFAVLLSSVDTGNE